MHTHRSHPLAAAVLVTPLAALLVLAGAAPAGAQCGSTALTDKDPVTVTTSPSYFSFSQYAPWWAAIAVDPATGSDWDLGVYESSQPYPACVSGPLAGSALAYGVDFVVGDFNHTPYGTYHAAVTFYSGSGSAEVEWNATNQLLAVNGPYVTMPLGNRVHVHDVWLEAGEEYSFSISHTGNADPQLFLFRNETGGACWKRRLDAEIATASTAYYTAPASDFYGVVVVNDNDLTGDARVSVKACLPPVALDDGVRQTSTLAINHYSFEQPGFYWTALGLRGSSYWGLDVYRSYPGTLAADCMDDLLGEAGGGTLVGLVVGDFNHNATGTYYGEMRCPMDLSSGTGTVQWARGEHSLYVNGMMIHGTFEASDLVRVWDVLLYPGRSYHLAFSPGGSTQRLLLFGSPGATEYWGDRGDALLTATGNRDFTVPEEGYYGVVVVNDGGAAGSHALAIGTCEDPPALVSGSPWTTWLAENHVQFTAAQRYWNVIGVRGSDPATDWDMVAQSGATTEPFPVCHGPELAVSDQGPPAVDFVVGDFNHNDLGTYHAWPHVYYDEGSGLGTVLWDGDAEQLVANGPSVVWTTGPDQFIRVWDVYLQGGTDYVFQFGSGVPGVRCLLFRNPGTGAFWTRRSGAEFDITSDGTSTYQAFTPPVTDWYAVVIVNDGGASGIAVLNVGSCSPPIPLASGVSTASGHSHAEYSFVQGDPYWSAFGASSDTQWFVTSGGTYAGYPFPACVSWAAASASGDLSLPESLTPVVAGDFNHAPFGTYYAQAGWQRETGTLGTVEWDAGRDLILVGAPAVQRATGPGDVLEAWDCLLEPQHAYTFAFTHTGFADVKLVIFRNPTEGAWWVGREDAEHTLSGTGTWTTTGTSPDYYGLVVVNDNGLEGTYSLQVIDPGATDVDDTAPVPTALTGVRPNPARGGVAIAFGLHEAAEVAFDVLDPTGRRVASLPARRCDPGRGTAVWDGRSTHGGHLPAGLYFVRMSSNGRVIGSARITLLE